MYSSIVLEEKSFFFIFVCVCAQKLAQTWKYLCHDVHQIFIVLQFILAWQNDVSNSIHFQIFPLEVKSEPMTTI